MLGLLIVAGLAVGWPHSANLHDPKPVSGSLIVTMMFSLVYIYYAYTGWNGASYLAGEIRDAQKVLPRAILIGTAVVMVLYLALNAVYALALPVAAVQDMVNDPANKQGLDVVAPIAEIASRQLFGPRWSTPLSVVIGLMLLSTLSVCLLLGPRVIYAMARAGQFPAMAARLTPQAGTPAVATAFQVGMTLVLLWTGSFESIVVYAGVGLSIFSMVAMRLDLRAPLEAAGSASPIPDSRLSADARGISWSDLLADRRGILPAAAGLGRIAREHSGGNPLLLLLEAGGLSTAADPASGRRRHDTLTSPWGPGRGQHATKSYVQVSR